MIIPTTTVPGHPDETLDVHRGRVLLGRYELVRRLGVGGQGEVWRARDRVACVDVAVKFLRRRDLEELAVLRREIATLRVLRVPGVAHFFDEGFDDGEAFVVMELVEGFPFPGMVAHNDKADGDDRWTALRRTTASLLEALARVHAMGVVHRDLKPGNVLVTLDGRPVILDFGVALGALERTGRGDEEVSGTPAYMAPELLLRHAPGAGVDLYSVGVMLFHAVSGALPFAAARDREELAARRWERARPLRELAPEAPADLASLVDALLDPDPARRPQSAAQALRSLQGAAGLRDGARVFPWLGPRDPIDEALAAARAGASVAVAGDGGSGRTRVLREVAAALRDEGRAVLAVAAGALPYESLADLDGLDALRAAASSGDDEERRVLARLAAEVDRGLVLVVDDHDVDAWTAHLLGRLGGRAPRVTACAEAPAGVASVRLRPLEEGHLRALFRCHERLFHRVSDAARALFARSGGVPARAVAEAQQWVTAGLAFWDGDRLRLARDAVEELRGSVPYARTVAVASPSPRLAAAPALLTDLLDLASLTWPHNGPELLARVAGVSRAEVDRCVRELEAVGLVRARADGSVEPAATDAGAQRRTRRARMRRRLVDHLEPGADGRLFHLVASIAEMPSGQAPSGLARRVVDEALALAGRMAAEQRLADATQALATGLLAVRAIFGLTTSARGAATLSLLRLWTRVALAEITQRALDRADYELCRLRATLDDDDPSVPGTERLQALAQAALAARVEGARAVAMLERVGALDDPELEWCRRALIMRAARRCTAGEHARLLARETAWARGTSNPFAAGAVALWEGWGHYRAGRFAEAARALGEAAAEQRHEAQRALMLTAAASSFVEVFRFAEAGALARAARDAAARVRYAYVEARAEWILRVVAYREGRFTPPDAELLDASAELGEREIDTAIRFTEAAHAWRVGELAAARALADDAHRQWSVSAMHDFALLARLLAVAAGAPAAPDELAALAARAARCENPGVAVQALALLAPLAPGLVSAHGEAAWDDAERIPLERWSTPLDLLSVDECRARLRGRAT